MALTLINPALPLNSNGPRKLGTSVERPSASAGNRPVANPECKACGGSGFESVLVDGASKARQCGCLKESIRCIKLGKIPPLYRLACLTTAKADPARHRDQPALFEAMRSDPRASYILCGANGCGKTMAGWMLYRFAVEQDRPAVGISCSELVAQYRAWQFDEMKAPAINADDLRGDTKRFLFVDEIDKARPTEFAAEALFALFDAAYSYEQQIVVTSNTPLDGLAEHWSRNAVTVGPSIVRRLMEIKNGILVDMF